MTQRQCQCLRFIFSAGVNGIFIYSDLCRQIQPPLFMRVFSLSSMGLSSWQRGYKANRYIFIFNLLYFGFESKAAFLSSREHLWCDLNSSIWTKPVHSSTIKDLVRILQELVTMAMNLDCREHRKTQARQMNSSSQPGRDHMLKDAQIYLKNPNLVGWKARALIPIYSCHEEYCC